MIELLDSRRLPGPNLFHARAGAVIDVAASGEEGPLLVDAWSRHARRLLDAVGWGDESVDRRRFPGGASLVLTAPVDALFAATEVNEEALASARAEVLGASLPDPDTQVARLRSGIERESNPALLRLRDAAAAHGVLFLSDEQRCSVGAGAGSKTFPADRLPDPDAVDWAHVHDVPLALVTGTNGKSTTVRAVAAMIRAAGRTPGSSSTDGVQVGDESLDRGDYSGPEGARMVLRDPRVDVAVLETARGGMLRRGLGVPRADVAALLNVAEDHLGEFGMNTLEDLVETKLVIRRAVASAGSLVLGLDDPSLHAWWRREGAIVDAFALDPDVVRAMRDGDAVGWSTWVDDGAFHLGRLDAVTRLVPVDEAPMTLGGSALHNVRNALAALLVAGRLGLTDEHLREGLLTFGRDPRANPGRTALFDLAGVRVLADFAHNPHGLAALFETAARLRPDRTLLVLGQAGDRDDDAIRAMCRVAWSARPDRIVLKEMERYRRGREAGEVLGLMEDELKRLGAVEGVISRSASERDAVRDALAWAEPGDLLLLPLHEDRDDALQLLERLRDAKWAPGEDLPKS